MAKTTLNLSLSRKPVMTLERSALKGDRVVYLLAANKPIKYPRGRSRIVYIGTTRRGVRRVASSVAHHAERVMARPGIRAVHAHLLRYTRRAGPWRAWMKLERAILFMFQYEYGGIPILNKVGLNFWPGEEFKYFSRKTLVKRIREFERIAAQELSTGHRQKRTGTARSTRRTRRRRSRH
jgi:hypothetical protein